MENNSLLRRLVRWGLYPASWVWIVLGLAMFLPMDADARPAWFLITLPLLLTYLFVELTLPLEPRWSMKRRNLLPDITYIILSGGTVGLLSVALAMASITISEQVDGPARHWPLWLQVPVLFLVFEWMNYHIHRAMHELRGPIGHVLWNIHVAHHLPRGLYLLMHAVSHPLNAVLIQGLAIILPIWLMGYQPEAVLIFLLVNAFHGIISHFNVDLRMGWANYLFVGPETHRYHHSADIREAKNYGATLTIWDQLLGTFVYRPGNSPNSLGTNPKDKLPEYHQVLSVLKLPFHHKRPG